MKISNFESDLAPEFVSRFVTALPGDEQIANYSRQVNGALYSRVFPTPASAPRTLIWSKAVAGILGLSAEFCGSKNFAEIFVGNKQIKGMQSYASRYGGHQFGRWAGQLGDGRVINLGDIMLSDNTHVTLQLKGAGPTPYSRGADGRAVLRSSIREFLCSEAMHFLGVPTTRALSLVLTGDVIVRDMFYDGHPQWEPSAVVCRVAPAFTRFGHFQLCAYRGEKELMCQLLDYTLEADFSGLNILVESGVHSRSEIYYRWFDEVCRRTSDMIVHWARVGFVHGVMNTDNMSILGLTIDYGPYGWLDSYDPDWTPNTTDSEMRRYRFGRQSASAHWNLYQLANALLVILDEPARLEESLHNYTDYHEQNLRKMLLSKLGLTLSDGDKDAEFLEEMNSVLQLHEIDMTLFFRSLPNFDELHPNCEFATAVKPALYNPITLTGETRARINAWGEEYARRLAREPTHPSERKRSMNAVNPLYVLRNYLAQEVIDLAYSGDYGMLYELHDVLQNPYEEQNGLSKYSQLRPEWARYKPGCSMLSCSS